MQMAFNHIVSEIVKMNDTRSFYDIINKYASASRDNYQYYFKYAWSFIPDEYLYEIYKDIVSDAPPDYYRGLFNPDLLKKVTALNKADTISNPELIELLDDDGYLTIYHGHVKKTMSGAYSWTLDLDIGHFFGCRNAFLQSAPEYYVVTGKAKLDDVIAYIPDRNEKEILILNKNVHSKKKEFFNYKENRDKYSKSEFSFEDME